MKGIIFNYLEDFITNRFGIEKWEALLEKCPMKSDKIFVGPGSYPDSDFLAIVGYIIKDLGVDKEAFLRDFGNAMFHDLARDYSIFVKMHQHPKSFLKSVEDIIHVEVRKLYQEATPPHFKYEDISPNKLNISYISKRKLCHLMEGIINGVAEHYQVPIDYRQTQCMHKGDEICKFELTFL